MSTEELDFLSRGLFHGTLLVSVFICLLTLLGVVQKVLQKGSKVKAQVDNLSTLKRWLARKNFEKVDWSGRDVYIGLLNQRVRYEREDWHVKFLDINFPNMGMDTFILSTVVEENHMDAWMNVTLQESAFLKLQLEGEHAKYGCVGFTAAVDKLQLKFQVTFQENGNQILMSTRKFSQPLVAFRIISKHPINVDPSVVDSLNACLEKVLTSLTLNEALLQSAPSLQFDSVDSGTTELAPKSVERPSQLLAPPKTSESPGEQEQDESVQIFLEAPTPTSSQPSSQTQLDIEDDDEKYDETADSEKDSEPSRSNRSRSPSPPTPSTITTGPWRRTRSYENLEHIIDHINMTPPKPNFKHSTSMSIGIRNGTLPIHRSLRKSGKGPRTPKRPTSNIYPPDIINGADFSSDALSFTTNSSEDLSVNSASDVSVTVLEVKDTNTGSLKHFVIDRSSRGTRRPQGSLKLHLYNGHTFIATHFKRFKNSVGPLTCSCCKKRIHGVVGKQAYQCRDCKMIVHKACHSSVGLNCPHSSISSMTMIYQGTDKLSNIY